LRIAWADPFARRYTVQYWTGEDPIKQPTKGAWLAFPGGMVTDGAGGTVTLGLAPSPQPVRFLRIWMTESSDTCDTHGSADRRRCVGYAVRELYLGTASGDGRFHDAIRHVPDPDQTATLCSSIDPWHEAADVNDRRDQVGLDLFYTSGYTRGLPAMIPVAMLYGTPEDAVAQIAYLEKRGYPISYVEMGEEPDGQYMLPEDYGALYRQWATALHRLDPALKLGGPVFEGVNEDIQVWPDAQGRTSWLGRFVDYLKAHGRLNDLSFVSFEHYPYDPCKIAWSSLYDEPALISHILQVWRDDGLPPDLPLFVTEVNLSWNSSEAFVDILGGLWLGDYVGAFLTAGGDGIYYFHYLPLGLRPGCNGSAGTFGMFTVDADYQVQQYTSQFFASQLINLEWVLPGGGEHRVFPATSDVRDPAGHVLVTAYALQRPDGQWSVMLVNKDLGERARRAARVPRRAVRGRPVGRGSRERRELRKRAIRVAPERKGRHRGSRRPARALEPDGGRGHAVQAAQSLAHGRARNARSDPGKAVATHPVGRLLAGQDVGVRGLVVGQHRPGQRARIAGTARRLDDRAGPPRGAPSGELAEEQGPVEAERGDGPLEGTAVLHRVVPMTLVEVQAEVPNQREPPGAGQADGGLVDGPPVDALDHVADERAHLGAADRRREPTRSESPGRPLGLVDDVPGADDGIAAVAFEDRLQDRVEEARPPARVRDESGPAAHLHAPQAPGAPKPEEVH
jgi:hypothetical protein